MERGSTVVVFNGEIWNFKQLRVELEELGRKFSTNGDTEVVAIALDEWGEEALPKMNGMFALAWWNGSTLKMARDRFGEIPLHVSFSNGKLLAASELKAFPESCGTITDVGPGELLVTKPGCRPMFNRWYAPPILPSEFDIDRASEVLREKLEASVSERSMSDVPRCTLLSGGIDSAIVAALLKRDCPELVAYTAVMDRRSPDLRAAREVAEFLSIPLVEVEVSPPSADDLASVIRTIEMPSKAQVEIGWPCVALAKRIAADGFKVTFSGEGSDELWGSYGFAFHALKTQDWHEYRRDLFLSQAAKNFPRCNKVFMSHGIECRLPFLNPGLVELALSLKREAVGTHSKPKLVLQNAVENLIPAKIRKRPKVAFQDALGSKAAAAKVLPNPRAFYRAEFRRMYGSWHER